ncbi:protein indeterminate-domain 5, chloroplastic-like [Mercurialis annua]|uniref:protein indeterminate-domain 5, chloroplastic-like n=1 Tax=Mercurialis annua TaxID=3986 RepID=UPI0021609BA3|nr:protein indeterminate-domain 5, chloroplastic-like [Mercurialis annua]XP_050233673.1 protein indeterminate-domain 5, chloroplastic-like [Mercurialis annua]
MAAASSSSPFFRARDENQSQMMQPNSSTTSTTSSTAPSTASAQKKKRNQPGTPNPDAEVIALSPKTLMATNRFICEVCNKGFQREQNLQLHRRGHNLPWKLKQKSTKEVKRKVYLCPEPTCVHHDPSRALGDLTGIKKHYSRKHGEKKWKCEKCSKRYAVQSDWKAHSKTCGTREYRCDCGTLFSRRDSFITHRAFCDALAQESARHPTGLNSIASHLYGNSHMSLGLSQVGSPISSLQDQNHPASNMLRLGSSGAAKFEHIMSPSSNSSSLSTMPGSGFFMSDGNQGSFSNKPLHGLMQLPDLQSPSNNSSAANNNLFNLSFFSNNNSGSRISNGTDHNSNSSGGMVNSGGFLNFNGGNGGQGTTLFPNNMGDHHHQVGSSGMPNLYSNSVQQENITPHMSATALLQKAAQMGSTTSNTNTNNNSTLLRTLGSSTSAGNKSDRPPLGSTNFGSCFVGIGDNHHHQSLGTQIESENQFQGLMNSLANTAGSSIFGGDHNSFGGFTSSGLSLEHGHNSANFSNVEDANKLTLDFLGVGGMVRNIGGGMNLSSLDTEIKSGQANKPF